VAAVMTITITITITITMITVTTMEVLVTMAMPACRNTTMRGHLSSILTELPHRHAQPRPFLRAHAAGVEDILAADARAS
jgi:hypothetical protein